MTKEELGKNLGTKPSQEHQVRAFNNTAGERGGMHVGGGCLTAFCTANPTVRFLIHLGTAVRSRDVVGS